MTGACRFIAQQRILSAHYSVCENMCAHVHIQCVSEADDVNRQEWQHFSSLDVLFGRSCSSWDPSTVGRLKFQNLVCARTVCIHVLLSLPLHHSGTSKGSCTPRGSRVIARCLQINALSSNHPSIQPRLARVFQFGAFEMAPLHALAAAGFGQMNQTPVQADTSGVINRMRGGGLSFEVTSLLLPNGDEGC